MPVSRPKLLLFAALSVTVGASSMPLQTAHRQAHNGGAAPTLLQRELAKIGYLAGVPGTPASNIGGRVATAFTPNDPYFQLVANWALTKPDFPDAWALTTGDPKVVIAILDSGVDASIPDLQGAVLPGYNFVSDNTDTSDDHGHGTMVASVAAARINNAIGIAGACGACSILPVKVADSTGFASWQTMAAGIIWAADQGARVISISFSGTQPYGPMADAVAYAESKGAVIVAAAGNDAGEGPEYPAALPGVISVEATDQNDNLYSFTNHGPSVTLAAPGCAAADLRGGNYTPFICGTSIATPLVAGAAGLLLSYQPTLTAAQVASALEQNADRVSDSQFGRLNVYRAMASFVAAPTSASPPEITGSHILGGVLTANSGDWNGTTPTSIGYQWLRCLNGHCVDIAGATSGTHTITSADQGRTLEITVTADNAAGQAVATSAGVVIRAAKPAHRSHPRGR